MIGYTDLNKRGNLVETSNGKTQKSIFVFPWTNYFIVWLCFSFSEIYSNKKTYKRFQQAPIGIKNRKPQQNINITILEVV